MLYYLEEIAIRVFWAGFIVAKDNVMIVIAGSTKTLHFSQEQHGRAHIGLDPVLIREVDLCIS